MYTEIIKIIEGGLNKDPGKVANYAKTLADNLEKSGDVEFSKKIRSVLQRKSSGTILLDGVSTKPVDHDSRNDIVDITYPAAASSAVIMDKYTKKEVEKFTALYQNRDKLLQKEGIDSAHSLLLYGPPGCGKTTIAKYISDCLELPLITVRMDEIVSSLLGNTSRNLHKVFKYASERECILFLDEFDAIAKPRGERDEVGELKRAVNSLLQNIDEYLPNNVLIAATNHHELLDPAIWRRFSQTIRIDLPQGADIEALLKIYLGRHYTDIVGTDKKRTCLCDSLSGLSHSDIKTISHNAIKNSIIKNKEKISYCDFLYEEYSYINHNATDDELIDFYLMAGATHREIYADAKMPLRKVQNASRNRGHKNER